MYTQGTTRTWPNPTSNLTPLHALHVLHGLGLCAEPEPRVERALRAALRHPVPAVRRGALQVLPRDARGLELVLSGRLLFDADAHVRLAALLALSEMPRSEAAGGAVLALLEDPANLRDRWLPDAATAAAARHDAGFLDAFLGSRREVPSEAGASPERVNLLADSDMGADVDTPIAWAVRNYSGEARHARDPNGRSGACLRIDSDAGADTSWFQSVAVEREASYRLRGWVRTEGFDAGTGRGAQFNVHEIQGSDNARTQGLAEADEWTPLQLNFETGGREEISINCLFGGWGRSTGTVYFDDVSLVRVDTPLVGGALGRVVSRVVRNYASRGPVDSIVSTIAALADAPEDVSALFLQSLSDGWPEGVAPELDEADGAALARVLEGASESARAQLLQLADRWGRRELFAGDATRVLDELRAGLADEGLDLSIHKAAYVVADETLLVAELLRLDVEPIEPGGALGANTF